MKGWICIALGWSVVAVLWAISVTCHAADEGH